ncbi:hypothetical protein [Flagellimonas meridianipacifica]|uniref:Secreted protein (Por secretion system target) n=1 Tax=Flagellimonas meridianipacifica TaxID=1080225 RepID=A0A2T0M6P5_9FLAO|nr:hypothetical protein [Allomuricauda pacifica]PRX53169.1 hypothetical protein CLV81_4076 [Allomuricauda pacifica]
MKSILKSFTVAGFLMISVMGLANGPASRFGKKGTAKAEVEKSLIEVTLDPVFVKKGDKLMLNLLNLTQGIVLLEVYDSENRLVYSEKIEGEVVVEKAFNFEKAYEDEYTVVVVDKLGTYKETMNIK